MTENELEKYVDEWRPVSEIPQMDWIDAYDFQPGMLLKLESGEVLLIGHTSPLGGSCDCCSKVDTDIEDSNVVAWTWLFELKENED